MVFAKTKAEIFGRMVNDLVCKVRVAKEQAKRDTENLIHLDSSLRSGIRKDMHDLIFSENFIKEIKEYARDYEILKYLIDSNRVDFKKTSKETKQDMAALEVSFEPLKRLGLRKSFNHFHKKAGLHNLGH